MKAAIMGFGTVGSGVYEVLDRNRETVRKKAGEPIEIKYILNRRDLPGSPVEDLVVHEDRDDPGGSRNGACGGDHGRHVSSL